jgi:hypothetical protein
MTYSEMMKMFAHKVKDYSVAQCKFAVADINEALDKYGDDLTDKYVVKLYCELDAVHDRLLKLRMS